MEKSLDRRPEMDKASFDGIFLSFPLPVMMTTFRQGTIVRMNRALESLLGFSARELAGRPVAPLYFEPSIQEYLSNRVEAAGAASDIEVAIRCRSGDIRHCLWSGQLIGFNRQPHVMTTLTDITAKKASPSTLDNHSRPIIDTIPDPLVVYDLKQRVVYLNPAFTKLFGWELSELIGKEIDFLPPEDFPSSREQIIATLKKGKPCIGFETRRLTKDGKLLNVRISAAVYTDAQGTPQGAVVNMQDISRLLQAEKEKADLERKLLQSDKMASIGQLAAGIAHEINNPTGFVSSNLHSLSSYLTDFVALYQKLKNMIATTEAKSLHECLNPDELKDLNAFEEEIDIGFLLEDSRSLIAECMEGTERIKKIVTDLKSFAHPGDNKSKYVDLNNSLDSTLNIVWNEIKYKADVHKDYGEIPLVKCYPQQLNQVFMNLLVNAAQSIQQRGQITIQTRYVSDQVVIRISDSGIGIPAENIPRIFDPFFTTKEVGKGTGLGLHVCHTIVERHHGTIQVQSQVGQGTTFTVSIPLEIRE